MSLISNSLLDKPEGSLSSSFLFLLPTAMGHANKSLVAAQGADSLRVDVSDVLNYPFTFSSLYKCNLRRFILLN